MFDAKNIYPEITIGQIFSSISEYDIFLRYCNNFKEIDKAFLSEFYEDKKADCYISQSKSNRLYYKDFGEAETLSCFEYVMKKYSCTFKESLHIICNDFNLFDVRSDLKPSLYIGREKSDVILKPKVRSTITIFPRNWDYNDYLYWSKYEITFELLDEYDVIPCKHVYLHKNEKTIIFNHNKFNPIYAYKFVFDDKYSYKIYKPLSPDKKYKWLFSGGVRYNIEGEDQLPLHGDLLIITKSLKDVMCLRVLGYSAISLQGEANRLERDLVDKMLKRFNEIAVLFDNDETGMKYSKIINDEYGFKIFFVPLNSGCKDVSDYIKKNGIREAKKMLNDVGL